MSQILCLDWYVDERGVLTYCEKTKPEALFILIPVSCIFLPIIQGMLRVFFLCEQSTEKESFHEH